MTEKEQVQRCSARSLYPDTWWGEVLHSSKLLPHSLVFQPKTKAFLTCNNHLYNHENC